MASDVVALRLRRAITLNDLSLVQRILRANPKLLCNPVFTEKAETSLHLAASLGLHDIVLHLVLLGHDCTTSSPQEPSSVQETGHNISVTTDGHTPLHLASANLHTPVVQLLCNYFPTTVNRRDKEGRTPLLLAAAAQTKSISMSPQPKPVVRAAEDVSALETLLQEGADVTIRDFRGNSCLHYACAFGNLKAIRVLIHAGADPSCMNYEGWKPELYSLTVQAEVYYRNLVTEFGNQLAEERRIVLNRTGTGGLRIVDEGDDYYDEEEDIFSGRSRADSGRSQSTFQTAMS